MLLNITNLIIAAVICYVINIIIMLLEEKRENHRYRTALQKHVSFEYLGPPIEHEQTTKAREVVG